MKLNWIKCTGNVWCNLKNLDLSDDHFNNIEGVYVIWFSGEGPNIVRVGQGNIRERITEHKNNPEILAYGKKHKLLVSWAEVPLQSHNGVEAFLAAELNPIVGDRFPDVRPIPVNLPD